MCVFTFFQLYQYYQIAESIKYRFTVVLLKTKFPVQKQVHYSPSLWRNRFWKDKTYCHLPGYLDSLSEKISSGGGDGDHR